MLGLKELQTATKMIAGIEAIYMVKRQMYLIIEIFDLTA